MGNNKEFLLGVVDLETGAVVPIAPTEINVDEYGQWTTHYEFDRIVDKNTPFVLLGSETFSVDFKMDQVDENFLRNILGMKPAPYSLSHENVERIIFNPPATIVFWTDGTKTVVKCTDTDEYDPEKGVLLAFLKKSLHNSSSALRKQLEEWTGEYKEKEHHESMMYALFKMIANKNKKEDNEHYGQCGPDNSEKKVSLQNAIDIIESYEVNGCGYCHTGGEEVETAFKMAVDALKEQRDKL